MREITEEMAKKYVEEGGVHYPFCGSVEIIADEDLHEVSTIYQKMSCDECGERWYDIYALARIMER